MGVLDDAIREHLELKRRHGTSEEELRRQEAEALGPARREPVVEERPRAAPLEDDASFAAPETELEPSFHAERGPAAELSREPPVEDERLGDEVPAGEALEDVGTGAVSGPGVPPTPEPAGIEPPSGEPTTRPFDIDALGDRREQATPEAIPEEAHGAEHDLLDEEELVEEELRSRGATEEPAPGLDRAEAEEGGTAAGEVDDDVLEETPEFLQETPEHERLWFEQKPPRDFDLDR